jgi:hypothetical protein
MASPISPVTGRMNSPFGTTLGTVRGTFADITNAQQLQDFERDHPLVDASSMRRSSMAGDQPCPRILLAVRPARHLDLTAR